MYALSSPHHEHLYFYDEVNDRYLNIEYFTCTTKADDQEIVIWSVIEDSEEGSCKDISRCMSACLEERIMNELELQTA